MIMNLATFFRTSLTIDPTEDIPLEQEIEFQQLYLDIVAVTRAKEGWVLKSGLCRR